MPRLLSVNIGAPTVLAGSASPTGIVKTPRSGPVLIDTLGVLGDAVLDRKHHGGPDQAVYVYLQSDYDLWTQDLGTPLAPGTFGENLVIDGVAADTLAIGDRFVIGPVVLEVTYHRTPCNTLARRMGDPGWVKRFARALRPGAYTRVITSGAVEAGMEVEFIRFAGERVTVVELMALDGVRDIDTAFLERALKTPLRQRTREKYLQTLATRTTP